MGFRDPIVSGEELVRSAISSEDFATGSAGWRVARDGQAEFNSLSVRDTVSVDNLIVNGDDFDTILAKKAGGIVGWHQRTTATPQVANNVEQAILRFTAILKAGKVYRLHMHGGAYYNGAAGGAHIDLYLKYSIGNGTAVDFTSPLMLQSSTPLPTAGFVYRFDTIRLIQGGATDQVFNFRMSCKGIFAPASANFQIYGSGVWPALCMVEELTDTLVDTGVDDNGTAPPPAVFKSFDIQPYASRSYAGNGDPVGGAGAYDNKYCMSGDIHIDGNRRSWMWFDANKNTGGNGLGSMNDMQGMGTLDYLDVFLYFPHWYTTAGGRTTIGCHGINAVTQWEQLGGTYGQKEAFWAGRNIGKWVSLKGTGIETAARNGNFEGLILGNTGDANIDNYGYAYGANGINGQQPGLRAGYYK